MHADPRDARSVIEQDAMTWRQMLIVLLCVLLNGLDGFDVLSISFASPGIAAEWGVDRAALGIILSIELVGMALGSIALGWAADRVGRVPIMIGSLLVMAAGMSAAALSTGVVMLACIRLVTGIGIGGMLACNNAVVAEVSSLKYRAGAVALMAAGYPFGAIVGGSIASSLLVEGTWRDIFWLGAGMTIAFLPAIILLVPESPEIILRRNAPDRALAKINRTMKRLGHAALDTVVPIARDETGDRSGLFRGAMRRITTLLVIAYFFHMLMFYFVLKWIPKIVVDLGSEPASAGSVLVWANIGGVTGSLLFSYLTTRLPLRGLLIGVFAFSFLALVWFGMNATGLGELKTAAALVGFFANAGVVGLYALVAASYPAHLRAGGTGLVIGLGRGGAAAGPAVAGFLFVGGFGLPLVALMMGVGSLVAAGAIFALRSPPKASVRP